MLYDHKMMKKLIALLPVLLICLSNLYAQPVIYCNQVGFDLNAPKIAVIGLDKPVNYTMIFDIKNTEDNTRAYQGSLGKPLRVDDWHTGKTYYQADFSALKKPGTYVVSVVIDGINYTSAPFRVDTDALARLTISSIIHYYNKQRATTPTELEVDSHMRLIGGGDKTVDVHGGWCDASGDVSKYFSHLAYANFMSPQQTPLVVWSMESASEGIPDLLKKWGLKDSLDNEAIYGADYLMRSLSPEGYFYMTVFSYFSKNPNDRRIVGLHANSVTTDEYQCAFREGGGMAIAALARISQWHKNGDFTSEQYLDAAKRAFAHLQANNLKYDDDHKENIIDDYCALMAATELWKATNDGAYRAEARRRAHNLAKRMTGRGYFIADDGRRPFWHASDAGLPVVALSRYLDMEKDQLMRRRVMFTIANTLEYNLRVTGEVDNPFGYARQTFLYKNEITDGFFIPHDNETGWWWQGENARLASLATAALLGGKAIDRVSDPHPFDPRFLVNRKTADPRNIYGINHRFATYASQQLSWILGCNPYSMCFMYGFGQKNVPYMHSQFGHGSERGGISNGITGKEGNGDGSGIDFKTEDNGNEWRWTEQWIPHAAWFLQAVSALAANEGGK